jgi:hypothetical protein
VDLMSIPFAEFQCDFHPDHPGEWIHKAAPENVRLGDNSYVYLGYVVTNEVEGAAFIKAYHTHAGPADAFEADLLVPASKWQPEPITLYRLRTAEALRADPATAHYDAARVPVVIEWPGHHRRGAKVTYLDGHTEYVAYPGKFPMTPAFINALRAIDWGIRVYPFVIERDKLAN